MLPCDELGPGEIIRKDIFERDPAVTKIASFEFQGETFLSCIQVQCSTTRKSIFFAGTHSLVVCAHPQDLVDCTKVWMVVVGDEGM